jgi:hypothetical protein
MISMNSNTQECIQGFGKKIKKRLLGKPGHIWANNIKIDLREILLRILTTLIWLRIETSGRFLWIWY